MKLVIDERVKHRLIGLAVILSIGAIFAPAMMKKSNQRFDNNVNVSVELPPKPAQPDVAMTEKEALFEEVKVAHVEIPDVSEELPVSTVAKAEFLSEINEPVVEPSMIAKIQETPGFKRMDKAPVVAANKPHTAPKKIAKAKPYIKPKAISKGKQSMPITKEVYAVQLATFAKQYNADSLVSQLRAKGYTATYNKFTTNDGVVYKVIVGKIKERKRAQFLQKQLVNAVQIRGFIVTTDLG